MARGLGATVTLLHVVEASAPRQVHGYTHLMNAEQAQTYLDGIAERLRGEHVAIGDGAILALDDVAADAAGIGERDHGAAALLAAGGGKLGIGDEVAEHAFAGRVGRARNGFADRAGRPIGPARAAPRFRRTSLERSTRGGRARAPRAERECARLAGAGAPRCPAPRAASGSHRAREGRKTGQTMIKTTQGITVSAPDVMITAPARVHNPTPATHNITPARKKCNHG